MGPINDESPEGFKYVLVFIDEFSDYSEVRPLRKKSQASSEAIAVLKLLSNLTGHVVKRVRTDGGTEFNGLSSYCRDTGVQHEVTVPHLHQMNGKIERLNRTLQDRVRCMLTDAKLDPEWWALAIDTASYVRNRCPVVGKVLTPHEALFGVKPDISHLKVFGSLCHVLTPKTQRDGKFHPVSKKGVFMGYSGKGYLVLLDNKVEYVKHIKVYESRTPLLDHEFSDVFEHVREPGVPYTTVTEVEVLPYSAEEVANSDVDMGGEGELEVEPQPQEETTSPCDLEEGHQLLEERELESLAPGHEDQEPLGARGTGPNFPLSLPCRI
jgi:hypothetical protein